ncbi:MAG: hypothetical protein IPO86_06115 [Saprospiraceae bacterium]|nr:hypothetical protein [Saprospiraceae bacterium]MBK9223159.1 hypothetical protein [Saprospiraceae bacterium]MBK9727678.1 hypothetical protein [Saprospiraceae bacterium]
MNKLNNLFKSIFCILFLILNQNNLWSQEDSIVPVKKPLISIKYFNIQGKTQYLNTQCNLKIDKKIEPIRNLKIKIYLDDETDEKNLITEATTNHDGNLISYIPTTFKNQWVQLNHHKFIAVTDSIPEIGSRQAETEINIARIKIDTVLDSDIRSVIVSFEERKDNTWIPAKDVEIKLGVKRLGSVLPLGEDETVTTDSTGTASTEFTKESLPGDPNGNFILIAKVEDNETYGNLEAETMVPWGVATNYENNFNKRSLWATGDKIPIWLLSVACFIIFSVWGTLILLVFRLLKIRKLGYK